MENNRYEVRGFFEKKGRAVYISQLNLVRTMQRALKRSKIPVWYTQGYTQRIYINFPLALSLGVESETEIMDFEILEEIPYDKLLDDLNRVMPEGLRFLSMNAPVCKNREIAFAEYIFEFSGEGLAGETLAEAFGKMMSLERIEAEKHSKKYGSVQIDIKPHINVISSKTSQDSFSAEIRLPAGNDLFINSNMLTEAFLKYGCPDIADVSVKRTKILKKDGELFA